MKKFRVLLNYITLLCNEMLYILITPFKKTKIERIYFNPSNNLFSTTVADISRLAASGITMD